jgi:hypothetical protein
LIWQETSAANSIEFASRFMPDSAQTGTAKGAVFIDSAFLLFLGTLTPALPLQAM